MIGGFFVRLSLATATRLIHACTELLHTSRGLSGLKSASHDAWLWLSVQISVASPLRIARKAVHFEKTGQAPLNVYLRFSPLSLPTSHTQKGPSFGLTLFCPCTLIYTTTMDLPRFKSVSDLSVSLSPRPQSARPRPTPRPQANAETKSPESLAENTAPNPEASQMQVSGTVDYSLRRTAEIPAAKPTRSLSVGDGLRHVQNSRALSEDNLKLKLDTLPNSSPKAITGVQVRHLLFLYTSL